MVHERAPVEAAESYALALAMAGDLERSRQVWRPDIPQRRTYYWQLGMAMRSETAPENSPMSSPGMRLAASTTPSNEAESVCW